VTTTSELLKEIREVRIIDIISYRSEERLREVNDLLKKGWIILETHKIDYGRPGEPNERVAYHMGMIPSAS